MASTSPKKHNPFTGPPDKAFDDAKYRTVPADARFPNADVTKWCFTAFVDHKKCLRLLGEKDECCAQFEKIYRTICPYAWTDKWEGQIAEGTFQVDLPEPRNKNQ
ncbi:hypothetical protein ABEB36_005547 [Hypothenemus hampei]|uniref:Cytochrome c oxidase subunit n=1 Tax=Hypothenemus hampei TaxID=57062 RepID=A0ABD1EYM0_HYPHA